MINQYNYGCTGYKYVANYLTQTDSKYDNPSILFNYWVNVVNVLSDWVNIPNVLLDWLFIW